MGSQNVHTLKGFGIINIFEEGIFYRKISKDQRVTCSQKSFPVSPFSEFSDTSGVIPDYYKEEV